MSDVIELEGIVVEVMPGTLFRVELPNGSKVIGHLSGKMRQNFIKIIVGDKVRIEISKYDLTKGRIVYRSKGV